MWGRAMDTRRETVALPGLSISEINGKTLYYVFRLRVVDTLPVVTDLWIVVGENL